VRAFLDTSVLIATFYEDHTHHEPSLEVFLKFGKRDVSCATHSLAEVFSVLTGMPGKNRVSADEAMLFISDIEERVSLVSSEISDYKQALLLASKLEIAGGAIYDALIAQAAMKVRARRIYTWNLKHFARLGPEIASRAISPDQE
jgi:predicted nucleic acid-binding protein